MMKTVAFAGFLVTALLISAQVASQTTLEKPPLIDDPAYTKPHQLVDIGGGRRLNLNCSGVGSPTVVFDSGLSEGTETWALVQASIARKNRTCSYDRAGRGFSDAAERPSDAKNSAEDLHTLLHAADIAPPYILVGHSSAGMYVRVFADRYRDEVVGLVIVDGSHEDQSSRSWAIGPGGPAKGKANWDASLADTSCVDAAKNGSIAKNDPSYKKCVGDADPRFSQAINDSALTYTATLKWQLAQASELKSVFYASADQTRATRKDFGHMPIIVLTKAPRSRGKDETQELLDRRTLIWEDMHTQVAAMSTHGVNEIVPRSGHEIQEDRPEIVVDAIQQTLSIANDQAQKLVVTPNK